MIYAYLAFQLIALGAFIMAWWWWRGHYLYWLEERRKRRGWSAFIFTLCFCWFQGIAIIMLFAESGATGESLIDIPELYNWGMFTGVMLIIVGTPVSFIGILFWCPRFLLPGWIKERLRAGDPVKTAHPIPEVQPFMTKPQNLKALTRVDEHGNETTTDPISGVIPSGPSAANAPGYSAGRSATFTPPQEGQGQSTRTSATAPHRQEIPQELLREFRVKTTRWWISGFMCLVVTVVLLAAVFGIPAAMFENPSFRMNMIRVAAVPASPWAALATFYFFRGAIRPDHSAVTQKGVSTRSFHLDWDEIKTVELVGDPASFKGWVEIHVTEHAFMRVGPQNRWLSGRPLHMGGRIAKNPVVRLQNNTNVPPVQIVEILRKAHALADPGQLWTEKPTNDDGGQHSASGHTTQGHAAQHPASKPSDQHTHNPSELFRQLREEGTLPGFSNDAPQGINDLHSVIEEIALDGLNVNSHIQVSDYDSAPPALQSTVLEVTRDALTNALQHSEDHKAQMTMTGGPQQGVELTFSHAREPGTHVTESMGAELNWMQHRVGSIGGSMHGQDDESETGQRRFNITVELPWR